MEMDILRDYFVHLSQLDPGSANRCAGREFQAVNVAGLLLKFCSAEETYTSLDFLKRKRFRRDNFLIALYETILDEIRRELACDNSHGKPGEASLGGGRSFTRRSVQVQLFEPMLELVELRKLLLQGYKLVSGSTSSVPFDAWLTIVDEAWDRYRRHDFVGPTEPLAVSIRLEILTIRHMILAQKAMGDYDLKGVTLNLYFAHGQYTQWRTLSYAPRRAQQPELELAPEPSSVLTIFTALAEQFNFKPAKTPLQVSNLMKWAEKLFDHLVAKMTLYFHRALLEREKLVGGDERTLWRRVAIDFHACSYTGRVRERVGLRDGPFIRGSKFAVANYARLRYRTIHPFIPIHASAPESNLGPLKLWPCRLSHHMVTAKDLALVGGFNDPWGERLNGIEGWIRGFRKRSGAHSVALIYEVEATKPFTKMGFECRLTPYPEDPPLDHWPNLVSMILSNTQTASRAQEGRCPTTSLTLAGANALSTALSVAGFKYPNACPTPAALPPTPVATQLASTFYPPTQFYDRKVGATYYLSHLDNQVTLAVVFLDKHTSRDTGALDFLIELTHHLRLTHVTNQLARAD
ncbi:hypothetical protein L0F63_006422 [Massospora cicadina]|nr:hypothetical protein L0F63_006422 [Massospora cicadina]